MGFNLLSVNADAKTIKGRKQGVLTGILYLIPSDGSGITNLCKYASAGCKAACLNTAGRGEMKPIQRGRQRKTELFVRNKTVFYHQLVRDIEALVRKADREGLTPAVRLNGTSDIPWERVKAFGVYGLKNLTIMEVFPTVQFYDYTKYPYGERPTESLPANYQLTFSHSETNGYEAIHNLKQGRSVAVVMDTRKGESLPEILWGWDVIDGDLSDTRHLDRQGVVVGLRAKGQAKHDDSGFVVKVSEKLNEVWL